MLNKSLDALWLKQRVVSDNIANKDTPNYKQKYVEFNELYQEEQCKSHFHNYTVNQMGKITKNGAKTQVLAEVKQDKTNSMTADGNNVDVARNMLELDRAQIQYRYVTEKINSDIRRLRQVMSDTKR